MKKRLLSAALVVFMVMAMFPLAASASTQEIEPNDTTNTATSISLNQQVTGSLASGGDKDYYKFTLTQNEMITVKFDFSSGVPNHTFKLLSGDGKAIFSQNFLNSSDAFPFETNRYNLPAGTYYVYVDNYYSTVNTGNYYITVSNETQLSNRETEYNDSMGTANEIIANKEYVGNLSDKNDKDYYKVTLPGNGAVSLTYEATGGVSNMTVKLFDSNSKAIFSQNFLNSSDVFPFTSNRYRLPAGTYYVYLDSYYSSVNNNDYKFTLNYTDESGKDIEQEYNDSATTANEISLNTPMIGNISTSSDKDYYKFTLGSQSDVTLKYNVTGGVSNMTVKLFDSNSKALLSKNFLSPNDVFPYSFETTTLPAGTYYVYVDSYYSTINNNDYTITVSTDGAAEPTPTPPADGKEPGGVGNESLNVGVKLWWTPMSGGVGYRVYRSEVEGEEGISASDFYITFNEFFDVNVDASKTYYYSIRQVISEAKPYEGIPEVLGPPSAQIKVTTVSEILGGNASDNAKPKKFITMTIGEPYMSINGVRAEIDPGRGTTPLILNNRTLVPIRAIVEGMGGTVGWNASNGEISLGYGGNSVKMWSGSKSINVNGSTSSMDIAPTIINERTMVPVRFAAENLGCEVDWLNSVRQAVIIYR